jgi:transposase InsO family protein
MSEAEMRYEIHDKEMLAVVEALKHWRDMLIGLQERFLVITDHRALEYFSTKRLLNPRQARWQDCLSEFNFKLMYRPGSENIVADALSRKHEELRTQKEKDIAARTSTLISPDQICDLEPAPQQDQHTPDSQTNTDRPLEGFELVDRILHLNRSSPSLERQRQLAHEGKQDWKLIDGRLTRFNRLMVPDDENLRTQLIAEAHNRLPSAHPGQRKTFHLLAPQYYWPNLRADCHTYVNNCRTCRRTHRPRDKTPGLLKPLPIGDRCWQHVQMDLHYMPKDQKGYDCVLVVVDRFGKRTFTLPCKRTIDAPGVAELYYTHIWRTYGAPETIISDQGGQFISTFTNELCKLTGVKQHFASTYHAPTNGGVEIVNQYIDQRLRPFINHYQDNWSDLLPAMDFAQATLKHESTGFSPYELELGFPPRLHFNWEERTRKAPSPTEQMTREQAQQYVQRNHQAIQIAKQNLETSQKQMATQANKTRREPDFTVGDSVYVTRKGWATGRPSLKLDHQLAGPFRITGMKGNSYELDLPLNMKMGNVFHADRLRKDPNNPLPGQIQDAEPPITINNKPEWTVDQILTSRLHRGTLQYQVSWSGWDPDNTWYPAENFIGAPHKIQEFHSRYPEAAGPPVRLQQWIDAYLKGDELEPCPEDNVAVKAGKKGRKRRHA